MTTSVLTDPVEIIKSDHRAVEALFAEYEALTDDAYEQKRDTVTRIIDLLEIHSEMEETLVYPRLLDAFPTEGDRRVEQAYAEHSVAKTLMEELRGLPPENPQFDAKVMVLKESIEHHVQEEEDLLLPKAQTSLSENALEEIGESMLAFRGERM